MKAGNIHSSHLSQALHLRFVGEPKSPIEKYNASILKIAPQNEVFRVSVEKEDLCCKVIRKSNLSETKEDADRARDTIITGINDAVITVLRHFDITVKKAAKRLKIVPDTCNMFGKLTELSVVRIKFV
jgi:hypothetical protein